MLNILISWLTITPVGVGSMFGFPFVSIFKPGIILEALVPPEIPWLSIMGNFLFWSFVVWLVLMGIKRLKKKPASVQPSFDQNK